MLVRPEQHILDKQRAQFHILTMVNVGIDGRFLRHTGYTLKKRGDVCMLKGVNHQIIEVRQTGDPFFERALLFFRADCEQRSEEDLRRHGEQFLKNAKPYTGLRRSRLLRRLQTAACLVSGGLGGVILGALLSRLG